MNLPFRPYPKSEQVKSKRVKFTQKQMGEISPSVDAKLKERSHGICECCGAADAIDRAHITSRGKLTHKTKLTDLLHLCRECHAFLDRTPEGKRLKRMTKACIESVIKDLT
ncbi:hypothetical protein [Paenibacillus larvae]|uniref:Uncharacterized protein n=1 Tax=Paenibacillus larvae subsp. larvae TaxID=147375 RepID=A0A6C0QV10_9BACL|nr:hypothetical protein [Paenibacillus larvae]QHZ52450.1 hypothetical protein ERICV_03339 [Paenibacillus larvae subsp. larvae]